MKEGGWILIILGVIAVAIGALMDVSVATSYYGSGSTYLPGGTYLPPVPGSVANIHKMHIQALVIQGGFAAILCGVLLACAGAIVDAIREGRDPPSDSALPAAVSSPQPVPEVRHEADLPQEPDTQRDDNVLAWIIGVAIAIFVVVILAAVISSSGRAPAANNVASEAENVRNEVNAALEQINELPAR
jgi:hypothetical protein